ncbi:MAG: class I SAM-dependent methyltransferase [Vulcanimicrobiaceae bacterium]
MAITELTTRTTVACPICGVPAKVAQRVPPAVYYGCPVCETLFQHPMPTIDQMRSYVEAEYARGVYNSYVAASDLKALTFATRAQRIAKRVNGGRLLDVGASAGFFVEQALLVGFDAYGVELSSEAVASAAAPIRERLTVGDVNALALEETTPFDVVTAFDLIEHVFDPIAFLAEVRRVARPGALLVITTPDVGHLLRYVLGARWPMFQPMQHTVLFSRRGLRLALTQAGYIDVEIGPATKTLTADYLAGQVDMYLPAAVKAYRAASKALPAKLRTAPVNVNIGELMAFARVPLGR